MNKKKHENCFHHHKNMLGFDDIKRKLYFVEGLTQRLEGYLHFMEISVPVL